MLLHGLVIFGWPVAGRCCTVPTSSHRDTFGKKCAFLFQRIAEKPAPNFVSAAYATYIYGKIAYDRIRKVFTYSFKIKHAQFCTIQCMPIVRAQLSVKNWYRNSAFIWITCLKKHPSLLASNGKEFTAQWSNFVVTRSSTTTESADKLIPRRDQSLLRDGWESTDR